MSKVSFKKQKSKKIKGAKKPPMTTRKKVIIAIASVLVIGGGAGALYYFLNRPVSAPEGKEQKEKYYSLLTGEEIADRELNKSPTYCIQIPNGEDGARPQVGLNSAGVVFEAIAEAGITRFAAIYQNTEDSAIGPIRSLRLYYLDWDAPFGCTVVHAGGSDEAVSAVSSYKDLTESTKYMWRITNSYWAPNNLFTSSELLAKHTDETYPEDKDPDLTAFPRLKPEKAEEIKKANEKAAKIDEETEEESEAESPDTEKAAEDPEVTPLVENITVNFGKNASFNTIYTWDNKTNSYKRSYANGSEHLSYTCPKDTDEKITAPKKQCGEPSQVAPKAVAVMMVDQYLDTDHYHLKTQTIGTGEAYVFQNGQAIKATWSKTSRDSQIIFRDEEGMEIAFTPGQLWIAAVPNSTGSVNYDGNTN